MTPQFVDLNADGKDDLLLSGYCGTTYVYYGKGNCLFSSGEILKDEENNPVNAGRYKLGVKTKLVYTVEKSKAVSSKSVTAVDWDSDGDYDLVMNTSYGIRLCINKGDKKQPLFSSKTTLLPLHASHYAYSFVDWDKDGLWDIVCGGINGGVFLYKNTGRHGKPEFNSSTCLFTDEDIEYNAFDLSTCQISVADYNDDGKLDVLLGGRCATYEWLDNITDIEKSKIRENIILGKKYYKKSKEVYNKIHHSVQGGYSKFKIILNKDDKYIEYTKKVNNYFGMVQSKVKRVNHSNVYVLFGK